MKNTGHNAGQWGSSCQPEGAAFMWTAHTLKADVPFNCSLSFCKLNLTLAHSLFLLLVKSSYIFFFVCGQSRVFDFSSHLGVVPPRLRNRKYARSTL